MFAILPDGVKVSVLLDNPFPVCLLSQHVQEPRLLPERVVLVPRHPPGHKLERFAGLIQADDLHGAGGGRDGRLRLRGDAIRVLLDHLGHLLLGHYLRKSFSRSKKIAKDTRSFKTFRTTAAQVSLKLVREGRPMGLKMGPEKLDFANGRPQKMATLKFQNPFMHCSLLPKKEDFETSLFVVAHFISSTW